MPGMMRRPVPAFPGLRVALVLTVALAAASSPAAAALRLALRSPQLASRTFALDQVYDRDGCQGRNVSPALFWSHPPPGTRSFAVLMFDSDAPGGWWHWAVFDIPAGVGSLPAGAGDPARHLLPPGAIQVRNDFGSPGYGGPCPPPGPPHHYHLMLFALRQASLGLGAGATPAQVASRVRANALAEAEIVRLYGR
jgi:Raf kinase inhibitor-like YbhB/YbcL family protein